ncbi:flavin-containing monooxygenase [Halostreptopolyspora alba]|uniref:NAD(P)/FAD-dependent oxidoreductase n=1 Tax=Halostreptopolyspora alba TaxID=2487137 RepID=A0A3N0ECH8_9ACTN|nr:NAD(P)/FAD-dependent oxidoreductase [Nocardiopsaceae bacterium YIM 96095]
MREDESTPRHYRVAIIGTGFAGLGMAARLKRDGLDDLVLLERANDVGGTWRDNTYPGAACDVPSHLYSLSFRRNPGWSRSFSGQPEIWRYLRKTAEDEDILGHIRFGHEVRSCRWDRDGNRWRIDTSQGTITAQFLVSGAGALCEPSLPDIPGLPEFQGTVFHSARWNHDHDLTGRNVAVIGTGASSIQFVPQIQPQVGHLHLFQRTPPWIIPRHDRDITRVEKWAYRNLPFTQTLARRSIYWGRENYIFGFVKNPKLMKGVEAISRAHMKRHVKDPELRAKLTPDYRAGCKRILLSNDYYPSLTRPNVSVVTDGISEVREKSVVTRDGTEREVDTIILGTGFHVSDIPIAAQIHDAEGVPLAQRWGDDPQALRGTTVAGYPNLFLLAGPNTGPGHTSHVFFIESQINYTMAALRYACRNRLDRLDPRPEAQDAYVRRVQRKTRGTVWVAGGCDSWYLNSKGNNVALWPGFSWEFALQTRKFDPHNYHLRKETPVRRTPTGAAA